MVAGRKLAGAFHPAAVEAWKVGFRAASSHGNMHKAAGYRETEQMI